MGVGALAVEVGSDPGRGAALGIRGRVEIAGVGDGGTHPGRGTGNRLERARRGPVRAAGRGPDVGSRRHRLAPPGPDPAGRVASGDDRAAVADGHADRGRRAGDAEKAVALPDADLDLSRLPSRGGERRCMVPVQK